MFELRDLERFMTIAEHKNFGRAAAALGMTQPALSRRIAILERQLGAALFSRARRQIELTRVGEVLVHEGRALLAQASLADRTMSEAVRGATGYLRLATRSMSRYRLFPEALRRLRASHPRVAVTLADPLMGLEFDLLRHGTVDLTVARGSLIHDGDLRAELLRSDPIVIALSEQHPFAQRDAVDVGDLAREPFIETVACGPYGYRDVARGVAARAGFVPRVAQTVDSLDSLVMCVAAGIGVGLMHDVSRELAIPGVVFRPLLPAGPSVDLQAVWRAGDENPVIAPFVQHLAAAAKYERRTDNRTQSARKRPRRRHA